MTNTSHTLDQADALNTKGSMCIVMKLMIAEALGATASDLKQGHNTFSANLRMRSHAFKDDVCRQLKKIKKSNTELEAKMEAGFEKVRAEVKKDSDALRAEVKADVGAQLKDLKQTMYWMMGTTVALICAASFLRPPYAHSANPGIGQIEQMENQQVRQELTQMQGQLTQIIEYLQASAEPGRPAPAFSATKTGDKQDSQPMQSAQPMQSTTTSAPPR
ncbi:MAG: hypothetical protein K0U66_07280 [Gammaproteobacteria bacterium]|nr:hypothetical protein [Gammaproteobacteria bacterium]